MIKLASILLCGFSLCAEQLPLPKSLASKSIVHARVRQLNNWSCGYNALYNACALEQQAGLDNSCSNRSHFESVCSTYVRAKRLDPHGATYNATLTDLAPQLKLENLCCLTFGKQNDIIPLFDSSTRINHKQSASRAEVDRLMGQAKKQRGVSYFDTLKQKMAAKDRCCLHFICNIDEGVKHWILVSVIKKSAKDVVLYICDNMNGRITDQSQIKRYIDYLYAVYIENT